MTQVRDLVDPKSVRAKLKNATVRFFFDQRQRERVTIKGDRLFVGVTGTFDSDVNAARKLPAVEFSTHLKKSRPGAVTRAQEFLARHSSLFPPLPFPLPSHQPPS